MLVVPQNFRAQPYQWLTNQTSHMGLGFVLAMLTCLAHFAAFGEYPYRAAIWCMIVIGYFGWAELSMQGWRGGDTIEDTVFVCGYGAGGFLYTLREVRPGTGDFTGNIWDAALFLAVAAAHLCIGCGIRIWQKHRQPASGGGTH